MPASRTDVESFLAVDLGTIYTRATLFDVVNGEYHYIATGISPSTLDAPYNDIGECVHNAVSNLQEISGRAMLSKESRVVVPTNAEGIGVDRMVMTYSAGPELRLVIAGLLPEVSLGSAQRLAQTVHAKVVETISITDRRKAEVQVDSILKGKPDLIILSGGTDNGANRSVLKLVELIMLVCKVLPQNSRPKVIYMGNAFLASKVKEVLKKWTNIATAPNIRPSLEIENVTGTMDMLGNVMTYLRGQTIGGFDSVSRGCSTPPMPTSHAMGRMVQFLSRINDPAKNVLAIDVGASATVVASANLGDLALNVLPYGMGTTVNSLAQPPFLDQILQFSSVPLAADLVRDYLWQKSLFPNALPMTEETFAIEQAALRLVLRLAARDFIARGRSDFLMAEPILVSGAPVNQLPSPEYALLALLDGLQPSGVSTLILDRNNILAGLGAIARVNTILPVQVLESNAFLNLGTVIAPISRARTGTHILKVTLEEEGGNKIKVDLHQGTLATLPLKLSQTGRITVEALNGAVIDPQHDRRSLSFKVTGGYCGVIIDARGRPLLLPKEPTRRQELYRKWFVSLGIKMS